MKFKDVEKNFKKALKKYKAIFITFALFLLLGAICLVLDYFNIPYKLGFNFNFLNLDFWSIFLGNGIVVALFITTFILFDKRNLEKDKLATYSSMLILLEAYRKIEFYAEIIKDCLFDSEEQVEATDKEKKALKNGPFKSDDRIFECLEKGQISKERYKAYSEIKSDYNLVLSFAVEMKGFDDFKRSHYAILVDKLNKEKSIIEEMINEQF